MESISLETLELLESRLHRIEYAVTGKTQRASEVPSHASTISSRLGSLERGLQSLAQGSEVVSELLQLQTRHPSYFHTLSASSPPSSLSSSQVLAIVLASAPLYSETASRLTSLADLTVPPTPALTSLISLQPRIAKSQARQEEQEREVGELRARTASLLERWYELRVVGQGEQWIEWEERLQGVEREVRREEGRKRREGEVF
ncbi:hypothetical protein EV356DRAFT_454763 [Viridothelium virens]|uniref:Nuclear distribution protein RO10 n=1 Tax=Viridothelium virens TaxID=1048519 RepID=A0A6A6GW51_VIRVR|nr:hypothetical protein EV356DRAFT_454763 [Viridothelium virens]